MCMKKKTGMDQGGMNKEAKGPIDMPIVIVQEKD